MVNNCSHHNGKNRPLAGCTVKMKVLGNFNYFLPKNQLIYGIQCSGTDCMYNTLSAWFLLEIPIIACIMILQTSILKPPN